MADSQAMPQNLREFKLRTGVGGFLLKEYPEMSSKPTSSVTWAQKPSFGLVKARNNLQYVVG
jgi:hypothetical protein